MDPTKHKQQQQQAEGDNDRPAAAARAAFHHEIGAELEEWHKCPERLKLGWRAAASAACEANEVNMTVIRKLLD